MHFFSTLLSTQILGATSPLMLLIFFAFALHFGKPEDFYTDAITSKL